MRKCCTKPTFFVIANVNYRGLRVPFDLTLAGNAFAKACASVCVRIYGSGCMCGMVSQKMNFRPIGILESIGRLVCSRA